RWRVVAFSFRCPISMSGTPLSASRSSGPCARMWTTIRGMCADVARWRVSMPTTFVSGHDIHGRCRSQRHEDPENDDADYRHQNDVAVSFHYRCLLYIEALIAMLAIPTILGVRGRGSHYHGRADAPQSL